jgi:hypothetical protein
LSAGKRVSSGVNLVRHTVGVTTYVPAHVRCHSVGVGDGLRGGAVWLTMAVGLMGLWVDGAMG